MQVAEVQELEPPPQLDQADLVVVVVGPVLHQHFFQCPEPPVAVAVEVAEPPINLALWADLELSYFVLLLLRHQPQVRPQSQPMMEKTFIHLLHQELLTFKLEKK
jgi:hypothetical protein